MKKWRKTRLFFLSQHWRRESVKQRTLLFYTVCVPESEGKKEGPRLAVYQQLLNVPVRSCCVHCSHAMHACSGTQACPTLCRSMDCSLPDFSIHGISQARLLKWVAISSSRDLPNPGIKPMSLAWASRFFATEPPGKPLIQQTLY